MMGNVTLKNSGTTTDNISIVRQKLHEGNLAGARHELLILSDEGANNTAYYLAASVVMFFIGNQEEAARLLRKAKSTDEPWSPELKQLYGQLFVEGAICKSLMRDTHADLVDAALAIAAQLLVSNGQDVHAMATTYIEILDHVATGKDAQALSLHQKMVSAWTDTTDTVLLSWKRVFDMAIFRSLCEHTRLADRLFAYQRGQVATNEREIYCVDMLGSILQSDVSRRTKLHAVRIFIFGQVGVWK